MANRFTSIVEVKLKTGIDHLRDIHLYEKVKRKILWFLFGGVTALTIILAFEVGQLYAVKYDLRQAQAQAKSMELKYGNKLLDCVTADKKIVSLTDQVTSAKQSSKDAKKEAYFNHITCAIVGWYSVYGEKKSQAAYKEVHTLVVTAFNGSSKLFKLKSIKLYAPDIRTCAVQELASACKESNLTLDPEPYHEKDGTLSYGPWQVNQVSIDFGFSQMLKYGLWSPKDNTWVGDTKNNFYMRLFIDEDRIKNGKDEAGNGHWDKSLLNLLLRVPGWEDIIW